MRRASCRLRRLLCEDEGISFGRCPRGMMGVPPENRVLGIKMRLLGVCEG